MELRATAYECDDCQCIFAVDIDALNDFPNVVEVACPKCKGGNIREVGDGDISVSEH